MSASSSSSPSMTPEAFVNMIVSDVQRLFDHEKTDFKFADAVNIVRAAEQGKLKDLESLLTSFYDRAMRQGVFGLQEAAAILNVLGQLNKLAESSQKKQKPSTPPSQSSSSLPPVRELDE